MCVRAFFLGPRKKVCVCCVKGSKFICTNFQTEKLEQLCTDVHEIFQSISLHFLIIANAFSGGGGSAE